MSNLDRSINFLVAFSRDSLVFLSTKIVLPFVPIPSQKGNFLKPILPTNEYSLASKRSIEDI